MKILPVVVLSLAVLVAVPGPARAVDAAAVDRCHQAIALGMTAVSRGRIAVVARCLKLLHYDSCMATDQHAIAHENELRNAVAGADSFCQAAIDSGASIGDFGPLSCPDDWGDCDTAIPAINTLGDLADCMICVERGYDLEIRDSIGLPRPAPTDVDERRCTRRIARLISYTARKSLYDTAACAEGNTKPFACPVDDSEESRFGAALATFPKNFAKCRIDEGEAPGALTNLCGGTATDSASLTACFEGLSRCLACRRANAALGQSEDCIAFSGFAGCDGMF